MSKTVARVIWLFALCILVSAVYLLWTHDRSTGQGRSRADTSLGATGSVEPRVADLATTPPEPGLVDQGAGGPPRRHESSVAPPPPPGSAATGEQIADAYARYGAESDAHRAWLQRNKYADDAHADLLLAMDLQSLRGLAARGDLAAQNELAYRLSRDPGSQIEAAELFRDAALQGSKESFSKTAESLEQGGVCSNAVQVNAYLQVAVMLGDLSAMPKYVACAHSMSAQDHGFSLVLAAKIYAALNAESLRRYQRPLQPDPHPMTDEVIAHFVRAAGGEEGDGG